MRSRFRLSSRPHARVAALRCGAGYYTTVVLLLKFEELGDEDAPPEWKCDGDALCSFFSSVCLHVHFFKETGGRSTQANSN